MTEYKYKVTNSAGGSCTVPPNSSFYLGYKKGKKVKAPKGSLGIMAFQTKEEAAKFTSFLSRIKRVIPIGEASFPSKVAALVDGEWLEKFYEDKSKDPDDIEMSYSPPKGTVCYPGVFVVD